VRSHHKCIYLNEKIRKNPLSWLPGLAVYQSVVTFRTSRRHNLRKNLEEEELVVKLIFRAFKTHVELPHLWRTFHLCWRWFMLNDSLKPSRWVKSHTEQKLNFYSIALVKKNPILLHLRCSYNAFNHTWIGSAYKSTTLQVLEYPKLLLYGFRPA